MSVLIMLELNCEKIEEKKYFRRKIRFTFGASKSERFEILGKSMLPKNTKIRNF